MAEIQYFSNDGLIKYREDLQNLKTVERRKVSQQIGEARDKGDLSENAEYDAAKEAQGLLELRISQMEEILSNARLLDASRMDNSKALIFSTVKVKNLANDQLMTYTLVS